MSFCSAKETMKVTSNMLPTYKAEDLTKGGDQANIALGDQVYSLRITRAGKLILTK